MKRILLIAALGIILIALAVPPIVFFSRNPVLVVTDVHFLAIYGPQRMQHQQRSVSFSLFRQVKPVMIADGAGPDIVLVALTEAASRPYCVIFPRHHSRAAERYHEDFPEIPIALIGGLTQPSGLPTPNGILCVYISDRDTDLYRAGLLAGISADRHRPGEDASEQKTIALWQDRGVTEEMRELFSQGVHEQDPEIAVVFASTLGAMPSDDNLLAAVLTGAGSDYLDRRPQVPVILFSWLDPVLVPRQVIALFDDSLWGLVVPAVQMAVNGVAEGEIPSKLLIISENIADNGIFRKLRKAAKKTLP